MENNNSNTPWPIYKKELVKIGNPFSSTGLCTLWTEKNRILKDISDKNYLVCGQCYSPNEGINLIIRHILANKQISRLVVCGADLSGSGDALIALGKNGIDNERNIIGFPNSKIENEIPIDAIERFRKNVEIIDKRNERDFSKLNEYLSGLENKPCWGEPEIYPRNLPNAPDQYPSETTGFIVRGKKVGDVWLKILDTILRFGYKKQSQYSDDQLEIIGLVSIISDEDPKNIEWKDYFQFTFEHFLSYLPQLMSPNVNENVNYTYGSKLRDFKGVNQIDSVVCQLKEAIFSRRAVAVTWNVVEDSSNPNSPCLDLIQALVQDKLHFTAYFRSNDMYRAWPENALALRNIQYEICEKLGVSPGDLIIISNSAHIYSSNWKDAKQILEKNPPKYEWEMNSKGQREPDPRGNILIDIENGKIKVTHLGPDGIRINEFFANSAIEAYKKIVQEQMVSQISHALDIGVELGKAEIALSLGKKYVQDKDLS
jgi:thymidylate synthase